MGTCVYVIISVINFRLGKIFTAGEDANRRFPQDVKRNAVINKADIILVFLISVTSIKVQ